MVDEIPSDDEVASRYFQELLKEESTLVDATVALRKASIEFELARERYKSVRDMVLCFLHTNPYDPESPARQFFQSTGYTDFPTKGAFRFYGMTVPDAAYMALLEAGEPLAIDVIARILTKGGIDTAEDKLKRGINAGLMNRSGVKRRKDGAFEYVGNLISDG